MRQWALAAVGTAAGAAMATAFGMGWRLWGALVELGLFVDPTCTGSQTGTVHVTPMCVRPASLMWTAGLTVLVVSLLTGAATYRIANR